MLYVFFVAQTITHTMRLSYATKDSLCMLTSACLSLKFRHRVCADCIPYSDNLLLFSTQDGLSPVFVASQGGHTEVVDLLVKAGADIHLVSTEVHVSTHTVYS